MRELADRVWVDPAFRSVADRLRRSWIASGVGVAFTDAPSLDEIAKATKTAAILACSNDPQHRRAAFQIATAAYDLHGASELPLDQVVRVVLARLGNFPSMSTRPAVREAREALPVGLIAEELLVTDRRTVRIGANRIILTDFQHELWSILTKNARLAVTAPTSAGKSFVLQSFLATLFENQGPCTVLYLVPTRALITQVSRSIRDGLSARPERPGSPEVATVPVEADLVPPSRAIYVLTPERAQVMLTAHARFSTDLVVVDEAQLVADGARGVRLLGVLRDLLVRNDRAQVLFASPGVRNLDVFGRMLGLADVYTLRSQEQTVAQNFVVVRVDNPDGGKISLHLAMSGGGTRPIAELDLRRRTVTRIEKLANVAARLGRGATNIIYANGPGDAEAVALELVKRLGNRALTPARIELARVAKESVHREYTLATCVRAGVAYHYSNMPAQLRLAVEDAVADGSIDFLVCTSTLLQGVNLPAQNIFMFRPEKGQHVPLQGVDFWNLAGRAGRLLKEFQGNIFLIDYDGWRSKPLKQARHAPVIPAIDSGVLRTGRLVATIGRAGPAPDNPNMEAVFVSLLGEYREGTLAATLARISAEHGIESSRTITVEAAISAASRLVSLPQQVLRRSPDISAHKQERLYQHLKDRAADRPAADALVPKRPDEPDAYASYAAALHACHVILLGLSRHSRLHRFRALLCIWWMQGRPLPRIVQNQLDRNPDGDKRAIIRDTLELVERDVRYQCVRLFACYNAVLAQLFDDVGLGELAGQIPEVPLFLEMGASDRTTISLMSLGISRPTATRLKAAAPSLMMDVEAVLGWLASDPDILSRLPPTAVGEVQSARKGGAASR